MSKVFIQIGTNDGDDLFKQKVLIEKPDVIILVEPNSNLIDEIKKNYKSISDFTNVIIYNNAVYYDNDSIVDLVIPAKGGIYGNVGANNRRYNHVNFSLLPMNDWGSKNDLATIKAKTITFDTICSNNSITTIDYLQIDTEGFDSEILKMINFEKYTIKTIRFEKWNFDPEAFSAHHPNKYKEYGKNGMDCVINKLLQYKYTIEEINDSDGNDYLAIKQ